MRRRYCWPYPMLDFGRRSWTGPRTVPCAQKLRALTESYALTRHTRGCLMTSRAGSCVRNWDGLGPEVATEETRDPLVRQSGER